jgi:glycogen phosphorylase
MIKPAKPDPDLELSLEEFRRTLESNLYYRMGQDARTASPYDFYRALSYTVRDLLVGRWRKTLEARAAANPKYVYYLSAEYLPGRQLSKNLLYTGAAALAGQALAHYGLELEDVLEWDQEPGLGNGGLGRLASCFLDSMATADIACIGYGIRYEFGIFTQTFRDGWQVEQPDQWLLLGNPWEFRQPDEMVEVKFGGYTDSYIDDNGRYRVNWYPSQGVLGEPYHMMVPGYDTTTVNMQRLWRARASEEFDFQLFDTGDYSRAVSQKTDSENISRVLYPSDHTPQGKELRLRQQYFFVACSLHDIVKRFMRANDDWQQFPDKVAIQLNDTHPVIAIPELMRILLDDHYLLWAEAWDIVRRTFAFTNHTLLPEALEVWPVSLFGRLLPRHLDLIYEINRRFVEDVRSRFPGDEERVARLSIIDESDEKSVRMAHLAAVGCHSVNGVAPLQSRLLAEQLMPDFYEMYPEKFGNKTNGVSQRRFLRLANPRLSGLISRQIGDGWLRDLELLQGLEALADKPAFRRRWREVKQANKADLAGFIETRMGLEVDPDSMFDVLVKRLHEYKRQLLKALHIVVLYNRLRADPGADMLPRTVIFGAKAAPATGRPS